MQHTYSIFGLRLASDKPISELPRIVDGAAPDVEIWMGQTPAWVTQGTTGSKELRFDSADAQDGLTASVRVWRYVESGAFRFVYRDGVEFVVDEHGQRISAEINELATLEDAGSYLIGAILGFVLRLRGRVALHASVVAIDDHAVVLLGGSGSGKSTTAAAFAVMGYEVLSDDVCVLVESDDEFCVEPAYPGIRLWPDAVKAMFGSEDALPKITPGWDKRVLTLAGGSLRFHSKRLPIGALYLLAESHRVEGSPRVRDLGRTGLMMNLVAMSYPGYLLNGEMKAGEFDYLARLATKVPGCEVEIYPDFKALPKVCSTIIEDFLERLDNRHDQASENTSSAMKHRFSTDCIVRGLEGK